eukprot:7966513-Alexandrium_andersonii.AAC.1
MADSRPWRGQIGPLARLKLLPLPAGCWLPILINRKTTAFVHPVAAVCSGINAQVDKSAKK